MTLRFELTLIFVLALSGGSALSPADAQSAEGDPVAIVEDITSTTAGLEFMDFVFAGRTIELAEDETLKLAYLQSCVVEAFQGGVITVGETESEVTGGTLEYRQEVDCDGGGIVPTKGQAEDVAGIVFRAPDTGDEEPLVMVYSTFPVFAFAEPVEELVLQRVDPGFEEEHRFQVGGDWIDLADQRVALAVGGLYRAKTETGAKLMRVSRRATATSSSVISRLVGL